MERGNLRQLNLICKSDVRSMLDIEYPCRRRMCNRGRLSASYDLTQSFHVPAGNSIHVDKDRHLSCASVTLRLEQMPDIILFRDCTLLSFYHSLIVVLDRTVPDFYIASLRCWTSNSRVAERCATGDGCPHLTTEHGHSVSRRDSIHGDKDRHLSCACATLRLEQMPDIILFRDCTLLSFLFLLFSCFPRFSL